MLYDRNEQRWLEHSRNRDYNALFRESRLIAEYRRRRHSRFYTDLQIDQEQAGVLGEIAAAVHFDFDPSPIVISDGSGPVDFRLDDGSTLDIKATWERDIPTKGKLKGGRLMVEKGHVGADIYCFARCFPDDDLGASAVLVGWAGAAHVLAHHPTWEGRGINRKHSHRIPVARLRPLDELDTRVRRALDARGRQRDVYSQLPIEERTDFESNVKYGVRWWPDRLMAEVYYNDANLGLIYAATDAQHKRMWFIVKDRANKPYRNPQAAIKAVIDAHIGKNTPVKLTEKQMSSPVYDIGRRKT